MKKPSRQKRGVKIHLWDERRIAASSKSLLQATGRRPTHVLSSPGRTELGGNHTDHNRGKVLAASVDLDALAVVASRSDSTIRIFSEGFGKPFVVQTADLAMRREEQGTSTSLIRGILAAVVEGGYAVGGFDAWVTSRVGVGSGLSSSACFELLVGSILNALYNGGKIPPLHLALAGQAAENNYFGKPCGLMDQLTCSMGGTLKIDFRDPKKPGIRQVHFDPREYGFDLLVVHTGSSHEDLTAEYAAIPQEMRSVARFLGAEHCREVDVADFLNRLPEVRVHCGDRAVLRCMHFFAENDRVEKQFQALKQRRFTEFLTLVQQSGDSSMKYLQNIFPASHPRNQSLMLALAQTDRFLSRHGAGACRVHGGGFAGTIQAYIPAHAIGSYRRTMGALFGGKSVLSLALRPTGVISQIL
jgi:galactokinase